MLPVFKEAILGAQDVMPIAPINDTCMNEL
jgi:glutamate formiminotransferase